MALWEYVSEGVWTDHRDIFKVNAIKTINLTVRTFFSTDIQTKACAMTYRTLLAIVPALALLFAIGRGFGFQNLLQGQLFAYFPSQRRALEMAFGFVDSALAQASEGVFVGVGIVFLLWTIISLLESVEDTFNQVWGVTVGRSFFRKITDYLAILIILPILMICSGGLQVMMSTTMQKILPHFFTPVLEVVLDCASYVFSWLFFVGAYMLIPNVKVSFKTALLGGVLAGTGFQIVQWLFVTGQMYVAKYNAIYGSFSFLPLMLIWMQLSWMITLAGALICRSAHDIAIFSYESQISDCSISYRRRVSLSILTVTVRRLASGEAPSTPAEISAKYSIPVRMILELVDILIRAGLLVRVLPQGTEALDPMRLPIQPSLPVDSYTIGYVNTTLNHLGQSDFLEQLDDHFPDYSTLPGDTLLKDVKVNEGV